MSTAEIETVKDAKNMENEKSSIEDQVPIASSENISANTVDTLSESKDAK